MLTPLGWIFVGLVFFGCLFTGIAVNFAMTRAGFQDWAGIAASIVGFSLMGLMFTQRFEDFLEKWFGR